MIARGYEPLLNEQNEQAVVVRLGSTNSSRKQASPKVLAYTFVRFPKGPLAQAAFGEARHDCRSIQLLVAHRPQLLQGRLQKL